MKLLHKLLLILLGACLFSIAWPPEGMPVLLFLAFVPILFLEDSITKEAKRPKLTLLLFTYSTFVIWNFHSTFWLYYASGAGGYAAILANALLMSIPFQLFHITKKHYGDRIAYLSLPFFWISFEYLHLNWDLSWAWLNIGNAFAVTPSIIQWYEYTGVLGGTLWVLLINIAIFQVIKSYFEGAFTPFKLIKPILFITLPLLVSYTLLGREIKVDKKVEVAMVQPNIDPYYDKFSGKTLQDQLNILLRLSKQVITPNTKFLLWPETALLNFNLNEPEKNFQVKGIQSLLDSFPNLNIISGASSYEVYDNIKTPTTRVNRAGTYYDEFNSSVHLTKDREIGVYQKSKLVPLVENIPYPEFFNLLSQFTIDLGGAVGSLGTQEEREVFFSRDSIGITPAICYESVFGAYATDFTEKGGQIFGILTNDAWWLYPEGGNGPFIGSDKGYRQHYHYAKLRAIENRRAIARSANTGISGTIDPFGNEMIKTEYWKEAAVIDELPVISELTFYTKHGNYLGRLALIVSILTLLIRFISRNTENFKYRK